MGLIRIYIIIIIIIIIIIKDIFSQKEVLGEPLQTRTLFE